MRIVQRIIILFMVGICAYPHLDDLSAVGASCDYYATFDGSASATNQPAASRFCSEFDRLAERMQQQYDATDALTSYTIGTRNQDNRLRTRRYDNISSNWSLRTHTQQLFAVLQRIAYSFTNRLNKTVALSQILPLSLPKEYISFPFHTFW